MIGEKDRRRIGEGSEEDNRRDGSEKDQGRIMEMDTEDNREGGRHLCCPSYSQGAVSHAHSIQAFARHICDGSIPIYHKAIPAT